MMTIELNGKALFVTAAEERVLRTLEREDWAAKKAKFVEGSTPRYQNTILPRSLRRRDALGISEVWKDRAKSRRERKFFSDHPRCQTGIFGNPRRIKVVLKKLDEQHDQKILRDHEADEQFDRQRAHDLSGWQSYCVIAASERLKHIKEEK